MKQLGREVAFAIGMLWMVCVAASFVTGQKTRNISIQQPEAPTVAYTAVPEDAVIGVLHDGAVEQMPLQAYLTGVLLCEMPSSFHPEAKKAQAVAARTFTLRVCGQGIKHAQGVVCADPGCCQGYLPPSAFLNAGGSEESLASARAAVDETAGLVLTYQDALIEATYFSCSGGMTEAAVAVWGADVPYLQAVESPGEEEAAYYTDTVRFSTTEFCSRLGQQLSGPPSGWFGAVTYTQGGGVDTMRVGGKTYKGTQLRSMLGLRSSSFTVTALTDCVLITTRGFGHRVGMSQYGADAMAQAGKSYQQILAHYYPNTSLVIWQ